MTLHSDALRVLEATSRTFYVPIVRLPATLQETVASAYLCLRAIDEIEDHVGLDNSTKSNVLRALSLALQTGIAPNEFGKLYKTLGIDPSCLPEVTLRIGDWSVLAPAAIAPRIWDATAAMADRMAYWAMNGWKIDTEADLDRYTFSVAGAVGLLLSDLWAWHDGTKTNRTNAIGFGRGLQSVNILRNRTEDLTRGVDFFPTNWNAEQVVTYARRNLLLADQYVAVLPVGPALDFCKIPLALADATLDAIVHGEAKLSRDAVLHLLEQLDLHK